MPLQRVVATTIYNYYKLLHDITWCHTLVTSHSHIIICHKEHYERFLSKLKAVDSKLFSFSFHSYFLFNLSSFLFLELGLGWPDHVVTHKSHQMTWSQVTSYIEVYKRFWKNDVIQHIQYMLTLRQTYGCLG